MTKVFMGFAFLAMAILSSCSGLHSNHPDYKSSPAKVETRAGSKIPYIILTPQAEIRHGISTVFPELSTDRRGRKSSRMPISSIVYDVLGNTWIYLKEAPQTYHRLLVELTDVNKGMATVTSREEISVPLVISGAAELLGTESGVGKR